MRAQFVVPRSFRLVTDGLHDVVIVGRCVWNVVAARVGLAAVSHQFGVEDVGETLEVIAAGTIAFAEDCIDVRTLAVHFVGQAYLRQQLVEGVTALVLQDGREHVGSVFTHDVCRERHVGPCAVVDADVAHVVAQAQRGRQAIGELQAALMEDAEVGLRQFECAGNVQVGRVHRHSACSLNRCGGSLVGGSHGSGFGHTTGYHARCNAAGHAGEDGVVHRCVDGCGDGRAKVTSEVNGSRVGQPFAREERTGCPLPTSLGVTLEGQFLGHSIHVLSLAHEVEVARRVVDVHQQVVMQMLVGGGGEEVEATGGILEVEACGEHIAAVARIAVRRRSGDAAVRGVEQPIGKTVLHHVLKVGDEVEREAVAGLPDHPRLQSALRVAVGTAARRAVAEETLLMLGKSGQRHSHTLAHLLAG